MAVSNIAVSNPSAAVPQLSFEQEGQAAAATALAVTKANAPAANEDFETMPKDQWGGLQKGRLGKPDERSLAQKVESTGNPIADRALQQFAALNEGNPQALTALHETAELVKAAPEKFLKPNGDFDERTFAHTVTQRFATDLPVRIPSLHENAQMSVHATTDWGVAKAYLESSPTQTPQQSAGALADADIMALAFITIMEAAKSAREDLKTIMDGVKDINKQKQGWRTVSEKVNKIAATQVGGEKDAKIDSDALLRAADLRAWNNGVEVQGLGSGKGAGEEIGQVSGGYEATGDHVHLEINTPGPNDTVMRGGLVIDAKNREGIQDAKETVKNKLDSLSEMGEMESLRLQMAMDRLSKLMSTLSNLLKKVSDTAQSITQNIK